MGNPSEIKLISEWFVRAEEEVEAARNPYYLAPMDLILLFTQPIQKALLFPFPNTPTRPDIESLLERLKRSLSIALVHFYPLSGQFETTQCDDGTLIYLDCTKGPGSRLIHATMDLTASDILSSTYVHPDVTSFFDLGERRINMDGLRKPLLTIQVTELRDGVVLGFTINHSVVDDTSFIHFVGALSEIFKSNGQNPIKISRMPICNKHIPEGLGPTFKIAMPEDLVYKYVTRIDPVELRNRIFHFSPGSIATLKAKANEECGSGNVSSYMALSGLLWRAMTRANNLGPDEETSFNLSYSTRDRVDPPVSDDYFGDYLGKVNVVCKVNELLGHSLGWAAMLLAQEIKKLNQEVIFESTKKLGEFLGVGKGSKGPQAFGAPSVVKMGGFHRFDMYGPECGMGRAASVLMGSASKDNGKVTVNPGREGRGSVDLEISLKPHLMSALESDEEFMTYVKLA